MPDSSIRLTSDKRRITQHAQLFAKICTCSKQNTIPVKLLTIYRQSMTAQSHLATDTGVFKSTSLNILYKDSGCVEREVVSQFCNVVPVLFRFRHQRDYFVLQAKAK